MNTTSTKPVVVRLDTKKGDRDLVLIWVSAVIGFGLEDSVRFTGEPWDEQRILTNDLVSFGVNVTIQEKLVLDIASRPAPPSWPCAETVANHAAILARRPELLEKTRGLR